LARKRVEQNRELVATGAGSKFDLEQAETNLAELTGQLASARSAELQARAGEQQAVAGQGEVQQKLGATVKGEFAQVAQIRAQLENAKWELEQTTTRSPCDCYVVNLQLRPGGFVAGLPLNPVVTLVEATGSVVALFSQNELHQVAPGNEAEFALQTIPGRVIKGKVDSIIWASGAGQVQSTGSLPMTGVLTAPPQRFAVKFDVADKDKDLFLAAGAAGAAAIYTEHAEFLHIIRKVILRVGSYLNYLVLKLH
jgi:multidrug resistance efflux pump